MKISVSVLGVLSFNYRRKKVTFDKSVFVNWLGSCEHPQSGPDLIKKVLSDLKITKKIREVEKINTASEWWGNAKKFLS